MAEDTAVRDDRRVAVLTQTMSGVLDTFRTRVPEIPAPGRRGGRQPSSRAARSRRAYSAAVTEFDEATGNGSLLHGEMLARWQDFAGHGDLLRNLQVRRAGRLAVRAGGAHRPGPAR